MVMMYVRFPLSLRNVEDLLFERGIDICHETVRLWWNRFTYNPASQIRTREVSNTAFTYKALVDRNLTYTVNNLNQYTAASGTAPATFAHNLNGNMKSEERHERQF